MVDVVDPRVDPGAPLDGVVVVVEPSWAGPAAAFALESGFASVEVAPARGEADRIPLVSFEQAPPADVVRPRCRIRCGDTHAVVARLRSAAGPVLLGAAVNRLPLAARLASQIVGGRPPSRVTFLPVPCGASTSADAWWVSGLLVRELLAELGGLATDLGDGAGMAVALVTPDDVVREQLAASVRARTWAARLSTVAADLDLAAQLDCVGAVPRLVTGAAGGDPVLVAWAGGGHDGS